MSFSPERRPTRILPRSKKMWVIGGVIWGSYTNRNLSANFNREFDPDRLDAVASIGVTVTAAIGGCVI